MAPIKNKADFHKKLPIKMLRLNHDNPPAEGEGIRYALYQGGSRVGDRAAIAHNLANLKKWAASAAEHKAQLMAVGELFLSGYNIWPDLIEDSVLTADEATEMIAPICKESNIALIVPYAERATVDGERQYFDSMVLIDKEGNLLRNYRKTLLWGDAEKTNWYSGYVNNPEEAYEVNQVNGINVGMLNCYEAEFPELFRILALKGAQLIVIPTAADVGTQERNGNWSEWAYPDVSRTSIPASSYSNKCFVSYVNHSLYEFRPDDTLTMIFLGNSVVADPYGEIMVHAHNAECLLVTDCVPGDYWATHPKGQSDFITDRRPSLFGAMTAMSATLPDGSVHKYPEDPNAAWHKK